jgi:hypothetical protein
MWASVSIANAKAVLPTSDGRSALPSSLTNISDEKITTVQHQELTSHQAETRRAPGALQSIKHAVTIDCLHESQVSGLHMTTKRLLP